MNADSDALKKVQLDLSAVDVTAPGSYQAFASLQKERVAPIKRFDQAQAGYAGGTCGFSVCY